MRASVREREIENNFIVVRRFVVLYLLSGGSVVDEGMVSPPIKGTEFAFGQCVQSNVAPIPAFAGRNRW